MSINTDILKKVMEADIRNIENYSITHHSENTPTRIQVMRDEILYIHQIEIQANASFWFEFHSATDSRLFKYTMVSPEIVNIEVVTRHKGNINFSQSTPVTFIVHYVKLKILP